MTLISEVSAVLIDQGFASAMGTDLFAWDLPPDPANCVMIKPWAGPGPVIASGGACTDRPGLQIYVRNSSKLAAETAAEAIRQYFKNRTASIRQAIVTTRSVPTYLGMDENGNYTFVVDFYIFG